MQHLIKPCWVRISSPDLAVGHACHACRERCMEELKFVADLTRERMRILTICSSTANQGRLYDKALIERLSECTARIRQAKQAVMQAYSLAARNTTLVPHSQVRRWRHSAWVTALNMHATSLETKKPCRQQWTSTLWTRTLQSMWFMSALGSC
jgi:hypothetical protein